MICFGDVPAGSVLPIMFTSYDGATGASETLSGLAVTDIEVYKGTSMTQRASDAGYTLLDTDGIDLDGVTGLNGFSIDTGDNTDSGFYAAGSFYTVVVSAVTIDTQTVNFIAATFRLREAETTAGRIEARVASMANGSVTAAAIATDAIDDDALSADAVTAIQSGLATSAALATVDTVVDAILVDTAEIGAAGAGLTALATQASVDTIDGVVDAILVDTAEIGAAGAGLTALASAADLATVDGNVDAILVDTGTDIPATLATLATAANLATVAGYLDTEIAAILEDTGTTLPAQISALNDLSAAEVNAEVVDALNVDTYAEPGQGAPASTASLVAKVGYIYKAWRNKKEQTATLHTLYNDDGTTAGQKSTVSDDGTTATRGEMVTGA